MAKILSVFTIGLPLSSCSFSIRTMATTTSAGHVLLGKFLPKMVLLDISLRSAYNNGNQQELVCKFLLQDLT